MRNCILGGDNFRAFRVDLGGQNSKGDNFQLYLENDLLTSTTSEVAQWIFSRNTFLNLVDQAEKNEL